MSMPSSRLLVATRAGSLPALRASSISSRCSLAIDPWWARTSSTGSPVSLCWVARSLRRAARRSARRRELTKIRVDVWAWIRSSRTGWIAGQIEWRTSGSPAAGPTSMSGTTRPSSAMSSTGTTTCSSSGLRTPASTTATGRGCHSPVFASRARPPRKRATSSRGRWVAERPMRCGWPLVAEVGEALESFEGKGEVGAPLGGRHRVDLVDDHVLHRPQHLAGLRREHEVEGLGGGDEDVGRVADQVAPVGLGRVAGAGGDADVGHRQAPPLGLHRHPRQGGTQVALDVVGEGLQRRDVEDLQPEFLVGRRRGGGGQPVEGPQEGGERLARPGGGEDEGVRAAADGLPAPLLGLGGGLEGALEPGAGYR